MRKLFVLLIPFILFAFDVKKEYLAKNYKSVCQYGSKNFYKLKKNEDLLSLIGMSCVKSDYFIYLPKIINALKYTKQGRNNSLYFSILFLEKKLLYSYMMDNTNLTYYRLPMINHPVSIVVTNLIQHKFEKKNDIIIIKHNKDIYKVCKDKEMKVYINIYKNNKLVESHWYR